MLFQLVNMFKALAQLDCLFLGYYSVNGGLNLLHRSFAALVNKLGDIKLFTGMVKHILGDGQGGLAKYITEYIIQFEIGYCEAVLRTILLTLNVRNILDKRRFDES